MFWIGEDLFFPPTHLASEDGIVAIGGDLRTERLALAYKSGIFPWFEEGGAIFWWAPDPRCVLYTEDIRISKSMRQVLRQQKFSVTVDTCFDQVIDHCAKISRSDQEGTWITAEMQAAYRKLHEQGDAHSVEVWYQGKLVGGLYGVSYGHIFFGESMFSKMSNASKVAFIHLAQRLAQKGFNMIDCQVTNAHLLSLGAREIPRTTFEKELANALEQPTYSGSWEHWFWK